MHLSPTSKLGYLSFNWANLGPQKTDSGVFIIILAAERGQSKAGNPSKEEVRESYG